MWNILSEERSDLPAFPHVARKRSGSRSTKGKERATDEETSPRSSINEGWATSSGLAQLYRGFTMGLTANAVFILASVGSGQGDDLGSGWTEL